MKFVIVGFGRVGRRVARILSEEGHGVIVVDPDSEKAERAERDGLTVIEGNGSEESTYESIDFESVDALGGLTGDLEVNRGACAIGREAGCRVVLRIDADVEESEYDEYEAEVDEVVYPERLGAAGAKTALLGGDFNAIADLTEELSLSSLMIPERSAAVGQRVSELDIPSDARLYAHGRAHEPMSIPLPRTTVEPGDRVALIATPEALTSVRERLQGEETP
ncbi:potassium transporter Trk [Halobacteriales archaeon QH_8_64_26]|jgi:trk system potassium uptake protein TrkA|nr:MAG: potassium transporter Trk [Halobacteriales archaeon QH_8_64_26]